MDSRFELRSYQILYEVPFYDPDNQDGIPELNQKLTSEYLNWFTVLDIGIKILQLPSLNYALLFSLIVRVDNDLLDIDKFEEEWDLMKSGINSAIEDLLKSRNLDYKVIQ